MSYCYENINHGGILRLEKPMEENENWKEITEEVWQLLYNRQIDYIKNN